MAVVIVRKHKDKANWKAVVVKFMVDRLLNDMELAAELEDALLHNHSTTSVFDSTFPELTQDEVANLDSSVFEEFAKARGIPANYADLDFSERSDRFHK